MKLKERPTDFRVLEVLREGFPERHGRHKVYRVTKSKFTTIEAADLLAAAADVEKSDISFAGLKDRQGVTVQYMSVDGGKRMQINEPGFTVEFVGDSDAPVESDWIDGNAFDITVRELNAEDIRCFRSWKVVVKTQGVPNYFDDQRFGSLRHGQGFIVREMMDGKIESALKRLLLYPSPFDPPREAAFKGRLRRAWGEFDQCVKLCHGGKHLSIFQHLAENPKDFAGAFRFVSKQIRLIHLYSYQSYLWNLTASAYLRRKLGSDKLVMLPTDAGQVVAYTELPYPQFAELSLKTIPLLAPNVVIKDRDVRAAVDEVLEKQEITLSQLVVPGVEGFAFKPEERALIVIPRHLRVLQPEDDELNPGFYKLRIRFELPRGSYATLAVKRLFANAKVREIKLEAPEPTTREVRIPPRREHNKYLKERTPVGRSPIRESGTMPESMRPPELPFDKEQNFRDRRPRSFSKSFDRDHPRARPGERADRPRFFKKSLDVSPGPPANTTTPPDVTNPANPPIITNPEGAPPVKKSYEVERPAAGASHARPNLEKQPFDRKPFDRKPYGSKPYGNKSYGNKPYGNKSFGRPSFGDRPASPRTGPAPGKSKFQKRVRPSDGKRPPQDDAGAPKE
ncbi:MAG: tRNA pseudouridine(13) synthase TruD [Planctomycetota bacterium]